MNTRSPTHSQIRQEATEWLIAFCEEEVDAPGRGKFNTWLRTSPEHVRAYLRISALWEATGRIAQGRKQDVEDLVRRAQSETNVVAMTPARPREVMPARRMAIAASLLVLAGAGLAAWWSLHPSHTYTTATGEQRTVMLADGSTVSLNARSRIAVHYGRSQRRIDLLEGQALFKVARDTARPFIVRSGGTDVEALGTQFDVNYKPGRVQVTVLEGRVAVSSRVLNPGDQVTITPQIIVASKRPNIEAATAWTNGLLMFDAAPLMDVAEEYNRHNLKPLVVEDAQLRQLRISGIFPASGSERITGFLRERFGVSIRETDSGIFITRG